MEQEQEDRLGEPLRVWWRLGPVEIEVPRDRDGSFAPQLVRKRQRRLDGIDQIVLSLSVRGLTTGDVAAHFAEVYGAKVSKDTISRISDKVLEEITEWCNRPLDRVYPVIFIDAIVVKVRDGQVFNRPIYVVVGVTVNGETCLRPSTRSTIALTPLPLRRPAPGNHGLHQIRYVSADL